MKLSLHPVILGTSMSFEDQVALATRHGFPGLDTGIEAIAALVEARGLQGAKEFFAAHGVQPAVWGLPVEWRRDEELFGEGLQALPKWAEVAQAIGCDRCCTWLMPSVNEDPAEVRATAMRRLGECARVLGDYGCRLGLEWVGPKTARTGTYDFIHRMDQLLDMEAEMGQPNLGLLVDSFHWYTAGHTRSELQAVPVDRIVHVHLNDAPDRPRDEQIDFERLLPGEGIIDLAAFLGALRTVGYEGYMGIETFSRELTSLPPDEAAARASAAGAAVLAQLG